MFLNYIGQEKARNKQAGIMHAFASVLCTVGMVWPASVSCLCDFSAMMGCNLELWAKAHPFFLRLPFVGIFYHSNRTIQNNYQASKEIAYVP